MSPYHLQSVQELQPKGYPHRKTFAERYLQQIAEQTTHLRRLDCLRMNELLQEREPKINM